MNSQDRRIWQRTSCSVPAKFRIGTIGPLHDATIINNSRIGIYLMGETALAEGEVLHVFVDKRQLSFHRGDDFKLCESTAKWCRPISTPESRHFGIGAQLDGWRQSIDGTAIQKIVYRCDDCEKDVPCDDIHKIEGPLYLCPDCFAHMQRIPEGPYKTAALRFLLGNIL